MESGGFRRDTAWAMSEENVEVVRRIYDAVMRRDKETVFALYDPEVHWDFSRSPIKNVVGTTHYQGHDGLREWWREWGEVWAAYEDERTELIDADEHVVSVVHSHGRGQSSGAEVEWTQYGVWTLRGGRVVRVAWFEDRAEALEAAGLSE
jgi:ketosteroid isomerase-like protein